MHSRTFYYNDFTRDIFYEWSDNDEIEVQGVKDNGQDIDFDEEEIKTSLENTFREERLEYA